MGVAWGRHHLCFYLAFMRLFHFISMRVKWNAVFCFSCLETCYWHLIEKRFCYDESIALYEVPEKEEKNNNCFDNLAFYDSVSVIAGRAIVTIDPLPEEKPIVQQPTRKLRWQNEVRNRIIPQEITRAIPRISETCEEDYGDRAEKRKSDSDTEEVKTNLDLTFFYLFCFLEKTNASPEVWTWHAWSSWQAKIRNP